MKYRAEEGVRGDKLLLGDDLLVEGVSRKHRRINNIVRVALLAAATVSVLTTIGIVVILINQSALFFGDDEIKFHRFLFDTVWQPTIGRYGILPLLTATLTTSAIALLFAIPTGLCVAIFLSEYASERVRSFVKPALEMLAGIPTVVYGYFAISFMTPFLKQIFGQDVVQFYNTASAGLTIGILILPIISSISEDALSAVPDSLREASFGLGGNRLQTSLQVVFPAAISGIAAACILALSRAVGETMIVALAAGAGPNLTLNPFHAAETITGYIVRISGGDVSYDTIDYNSIFALALALFVITMVLNIISRQISSHFREEYE